MQAYYDKATNGSITMHLSGKYKRFSGRIVIPKESRDNTGQTAIVIKDANNDRIQFSKDLKGSTASTSFDINVSGVFSLTIDSVTDKDNPGPSVIFLDDKIQ